MQKYLHKKLPVEQAEMPVRYLINFAQVLSNTHIVRTDFRNANLSRVNLNSCRLVSAILTNTNLSGTNFRNSNLSYANLSYANLTNANLQFVNLTGVNLTDANLTNALFCNTIMPDGRIENDLDRVITKDASSIVFNDQLDGDGQRSCQFLMLQKSSENYEPNRII